MRCSGPRIHLQIPCTANHESIVTSSASPRLLSHNSTSTTSALLNHQLISSTNYTLPLIHYLTIRSSTQQTIPLPLVHYLTIRSSTQKTIPLPLIHYLTIRSSTQQTIPLLLLHYLTISSSTQQQHHRHLLHPDISYDCHYVCFCFPRGTVTIGSEFLLKKLKIISGQKC